MNKVEHDYMVVEIPHNVTIPEAYAKMRLMKLARERGSCKHIVATVSGFAGDARGLWQIPEARQMATMLNSIGFASYLDPSTMFHKEGMNITLGLYELWLIETGNGKPDKEHWNSGGVVAMLIQDANDKSDEALGEFVNPPKQKLQAKPSAN